MRVHTLNLLQHPRRPGAVWRGHLLWGLLGFSAVLFLVGLVQVRRSAFEREHQHWRQQLAQQAQGQTRQRLMREQQQVHLQLQALRQGVQAQQQRVLALQAALQHEAGQGLRLTRWQADGQKLLLQGLWPQAEGFAALQSRLDQALGARWTLLGLAAAPLGEGVSWALEAPWVPASAARGGL